MHVLEWALAGALALAIPIVAEAVPLGSHMPPTGVGPALGAVQVWDGGRASGA